MSLEDISSYERTARLLASSPHLGQYFRYLALDIKALPRDYAPLQSILAPLSEIEYLTIAGDSASAATSNQIAQNPCLIDLLSVPTLRYFALQDLVDVPSSLISRAFSSFEQVLLLRISIDITDEEDQPTEGSESSPVDLWHLGVVFDGYESILPFVLHPRSKGFVQQLGRLSVTIPPITESLQPKFTELLVACSSTLEDLEIELEIPPTYLPTLPALIFLELWIDVEVTKTPGLLDSIISETIASTPHVEVLTISLLDRPSVPHRPDPQQWTDRSPLDWAGLDSALMDMPDLYEVDFSLRWFHNQPERYIAFVPYVQAHLPRAFDAGLLGFNYCSCFQHSMDRFARD
ncbi:hypothetical protein B0H19DRAFT_1097698 [Mycena capillaripes]|nr:hypothetical protein B0H19DRAFT_1097698 [Mycena capillaripes]